MDMQEIGMLAGLALGGFGLFLMAWKTALRRRNAAAAEARAALPEPPSPVPQPAASPAPAAAGPDPLLRRLERRMEEIEAVQADLAERLAVLAEDGSAQKLQAMAGSLLTLVRDKNATMETALAGLDGMRARLTTLESVGDLGEARALLERLKGRIEAVEGAQARAAEAREAEARAAEARAAEIRGLETRIAAFGAAAEAREEERRAAEARESERRAAEAAEGPGALAAVTEALARLHAGKEAAVETVFARLGPVEAKLAAIEGRMAGLDPQAALDRFAERLEAVQARLAGLDVMGERLGALEAGGAASHEALAAIAAEFSRLKERGEAGSEAVLGRLGALEARLAAAEAEAAGGRAEGEAARDAVAGMAGEVAGLRAELRAEMQAELRAAEAVAREAALGLERLEALQEEGARAGENRFAAFGERLAELQVQREAAIGAVLARVGALEETLGGVAGRVGDLAPAAALAVAEARTEARLDAIGARMDAMVAEGSKPFAEITGQLAGLYAQKDAAVETVLGRLAPLEAKLGEAEARLGGVEARMAGLDPAAALARFAERVEAAERAQAALAGRMGALADPGGALAAIRLEVAGMREQRDAALDAATARLAGLERALAEVEARGLSEAEARAEAQAIAAQMIATRTVAEETRLFASRLSLLEASLPRLSLSQTLMMQALQRLSGPWDASLAASAGPEPQIVPPSRSRPAPREAPAEAAAGDLPDVWRNPRVVSLHLSGS